MKVAEAWSLPYGTVKYIYGPVRNTVIKSFVEENIEYNTGYSVSPEVSARPRVGSPEGRRPEGDPTRGRAGTEGDAEYTKVKKHKAVTRRKKRQLPTTTTNHNDDTAEPVFFLQAQQSTRVSIHETLAVALAGNPGIGGKRSELISALTLKNSGFPV
ncbi:hypothetical protein Bbelb_216720 [Branchiostoma belcheri]|nr:hypothetical protein Bbelb_216720 [Branchiostoma belcheri]